MNCPVCGGQSTLLASTHTKDHNLRHYYRCHACFRTFKTIECHFDLYNERLRRRASDTKVVEQIRTVRDSAKKLQSALTKLIGLNRPVE